MQRRPARFSLIASYAIVLSLAVGSEASPTASEPVLQTQTFTGTLQPLGLDFKRSPSPTLWARAI